MSTTRPTTRAAGRASPADQANPARSRAPNTGAPSTRAPGTRGPSTGAPSTGAPNTGAPSTGAPDSRATRRAFALLGTVQVTLIFTITLVAVPLPAIGREFGLATSGLVLVSAAYGLAFSGLLLFGGRLADRFGGRPLFATGLVVFAAASVAAAAAPDAAVLIAARFAEGIGAALTAPAAMAVLPTLFPGKGQHGRAMATWGGLSVLGATAGIVLSGVVTTWLSWRWMFGIAVLVSLTVRLLAPRWLPDTGPRRRGPLDLPGAVLATAGVTLLSYGLVISGGRAWSRPAVLAPVGAGLALLVAFAVAESRRRDPLLPLAFLASRRRLVALAAIAVSAAGTTVLFLLLSLYLQQVRGWPPLRTSLAFGPSALCLVLAGRVASRSIARFGARRVLVAGLVVAAAGLLLLVRLAPHTGYPAGLLPGMALLPAGAALVFAGAAVLATEGVPQQQAGLAGGVMNTAMELGPTAGLAVLVTVAAARTAHLTAAGVGRAAAVTGGYAWALGCAGLAFALLILPALVTTDNDG